MPNCPKCNSKVTEAMSFCPTCGASLKAAPPPAPAPAPAPPVRQEKQEKQEKGEKSEKQEPEKGEKHEKQGAGLLAPIIGGIILIMLGVMAYLSLLNWVNQQMLGAYFLVVIGIMVILAALYGARLATRRHPPA